MLIALFLLACVSEAPVVCVSVSNHRPFVVEVDGEEQIVANAGDVVDVCVEDGAFVEVFDYINSEFPR